MFENGTYDLARCPTDPESSEAYQAGKSAIEGYRKDGRILEVLFKEIAPTSLALANKKCTDMGMRLPSRDEVTKLALVVNNGLKGYGGASAPEYTVWHTGGSCFNYPPGGTPSADNCNGKTILPALCIPKDGPFQTQFPF